MAVVAGQKPEEGFFGLVVAKYQLLHSEPQIHRFELVVVVVEHSSVMKYSLEKQTALDYCFEFGCWKTWIREVFVLKQKL